MSSGAAKPLCVHMRQALRGALLKKYAKIRNEIDRLHNSRMSPYEKTESLEAIRSHIMAAWRTDEIRRTKPSPQVQTLQLYVLLQPPFYQIVWLNYATHNL